MSSLSLLLAATLWKFRIYACTPLMWFSFSPKLDASMKTGFWPLFVSKWSVSVHIFNFAAFL